MVCKKSIIKWVSDECFIQSYANEKQTELFVFSKENSKNFE